MRRALEILAILPATLIYGGTIAWATLLSLVRVAADFTNMIESMGFFETIKEIFVGIVVLFMWSIPLLAFVILWCLVLGCDSWIHRRPRLRMCLAVMGLFFVLVVGWGNLINLFEWQRPDVVRLGLIALGPVIVGSIYLVKFASLLCRAEQTQGVRVDDRT